MEPLKIRYSNYLPYKSKYFYKIMIIGDSMIWGDGLNKDVETFPYILDEVLNSNPKGFIYEIINLSTCGWSIYDYTSILKLNIKDYNPDLILISLCNNDIEIFPCNDNNEYPKHIENIWKDEFILNSFENIVKQIKGISEEYQTPIVFLHYNLYIPHSHHGKILKNILDKYSLPLIDLTDVFKNYSYESVTISSINNHPNAMANRIAASYIATFLYQNNLLPKEKVLTQTEFDDFLNNLQLSQTPYLIPFIEKIKKLPINTESNLLQITLKSVFLSYEKWLQDNINNIELFNKFTLLSLECAKIYKFILISDFIMQVNDNSNNLNFDSIYSIKERINLYLSIINELNLDFNNYFLPFTSWVFSTLKNYLEQLYTIAEEIIKRKELITANYLSNGYGIVLNKFIEIFNQLNEFINVISLAKLKNLVYNNYKLESLNRTLSISITFSFQSSKIGRIFMTFISYIPYCVKDKRLSLVNDLNLANLQTFSLDLTYSYMAKLYIETQDINIINLAIYRGNEKLIEYGDIKGLPAKFTANLIPVFLLP